MFVCVFSSRTLRLLRALILDDIVTIQREGVHICYMFCLLRFQFENTETEIVESVGTYELKLCRMSGARGKVAVPYTTEEGTAKAGKDYEHVEGELIFCNEENE